VDPNDMKLRTQVQAQFVRHWIALDYIRLQVVGSDLTVRGVIELLPSREAEGEQVTPTVLTQIDSGLRSLRHLHLIRWRLDNWRYDGGTFTEAE
jgi:hypothetical protein